MIMDTISKTIIALEKIIILAFISGIISINGYSQENTVQNFFQRNLNHRIYLGLYSSYFDDNIRLMQAGYDCVLKLIHISPEFNLVDAGIGLNALMAFDDKGGSNNGRPQNARITPGFELNWSVRLYVLPVKKINSRIYLEGLGMSLVAYAREYPDNGTRANIGSHVGLGMEYPVNNHKAYTTLKLFHSSNGKPYENNPALNAVGILMGMQF
jgi:hypothetical protein